MKKKNKLLPLVVIGAGVGGLYLYSRMKKAEAAQAFLKTTSGRSIVNAAGVTAAEAASAVLASMVPGGAGVVPGAAMQAAVAAAMPTDQQMLEAALKERVENAGRQVWEGLQASF